MVFVDGATTAYLHLQPNASFDMETPLFIKTDIALIIILNGFLDKPFIKK
jgi:hypothetical protein